MNWNFSGRVFAACAITRTQHEIRSWCGQLRETFVATGFLRVNCPALMSPLCCIPCRAGAQAGCIINIFFLPASLRATRHVVKCDDLDLRINIWNERRKHALNPCDA